jgi:hypothetical protein
MTRALVRSLVGSLAAIIALGSAVRAQGLDLSRLELPPGFLDLTDLNITTRSDQSITATATTTLLNANTLVLLSATPSATGRRGIILGLKPDDWSLAKSIPALDMPPFNSLTLSNVGLVITDQDLRESSSLMHLQDYDFYREIYKADDYELVLKPGINLISAIPMGELEPDHPLVRLSDALGIEKGNILLQGTLGQSLTLIGAPGAGVGNVIKDLYLRAELPPMRPPGSPEWFRSGQLAVELTGDPSMRLAGEMVVRMDGEDLKFFIATTVARTGLSVSGGLVADEDGWQQPFGVEWLVLKGVVLRLGITASGSVEPGFAARMVIGEKDIDVAIALAISPAGVPTNFMAKGESEAGVALSDIVKLQQQMAAARAAAAEATGAPEPAGPAVDLDALPDIAFRSLGLQFAPKAFPELDVERGMAIKGRMWLQLSPGGELTDFAGVDVSVGEDGFWARGDLGAFELGPLRWEDAKLDLTATREAQHFMVNGEAELFGARQLLDVNLSRRGFSFRSETDLFGLFTADLTCESVFDLRTPSFQVDAVVHNDFGDVVAPLFQSGLVEYAARGQEIAAGARTAADAVDRALADAQATADQLRRTLEAQRAEAYATVLAREQDVARVHSRLLIALAARNRAWSVLQGTPFRQAGLRTQRQLAYAAANARYLMVAGTYNGARAVLAAARAVLDALPPVDQNILLLAADAATAALRSQLGVARDRLRVLEERFAAIGDAAARGEQLLAVEHAEFHGRLARASGGGAMDWTITGTFVGRPFEVRRSLDFSNVGLATAQILEQLLRG